jgi:hypothetical protein
MLKSIIFIGISYRRGADSPVHHRLFLARKAQIDRAVVGESARWGDAKRGRP